jgi:hypothetical protein
MVLLVANCNVRSAILEGQDAACGAPVNALVLSQNLREFAWNCFLLVEVPEGLCCMFRPGKAWLMLPGFLLYAASRSVLRDGPRGLTRSPLERDAKQTRRQENEVALRNTMA